MDINEIARRAGVSRATVSRYLNNGYVSQEKRALIGRIIEETGYVPSHRAQQLRTGKTNLVSVIIPKINSQSVSRMVAGVTTVLAQNGYQALMATTENESSKEVEYLRLFAGRNHVDGIILIATEFTPAHRAAIAELHIPLVVLGQRLEGTPCVYQDDRTALCEVTRLVLPKARRIGYLGVFEEDYSAGYSRHQGFLDACAEAGVEVLPEAQQVVGFDADDGYFGAERLLDAIPDIDTIVCATDDIAFGAMMCMREYGRRVPEDVQVTGVGDSMLSRIVHPSLTTVHLFFKTSGMYAAQLLIGQIEGNEPGVPEACLGFEVYGRNSMR